MNVQVDVDNFVRSHRVHSLQVVALMPKLVSCRGTVALSAREAHKQNVPRLILSLWKLQCCT